MKPSELRELSDAELNTQVDVLKDELFNLRFAQATGELENPNRMKQVKKDIARIKTIQNERKAAAK